MSEDATEAPSTETLTEETIDLVAELPKIADWLPDSIRPFWEVVATYPVVGAAVVAAVFYLAAFIIRSVVLASLDRLAARSDTTIDNAVIAHLRRPIFTSIFFFGLILAANVTKLPFGTSFIINLLASVIVVSWMLATLRISNTALDALSDNPRFTLIESRTIPLFDLTLKLGVILIASYCLLIIWGINPIGWLASAGIVGIAVGFAAKDTLANLFSGFFILADAPYKLGDFINLDSGERGRITSIGIRSTRLLTREDVEITIPNAVIANAKITNESGGPHEKLRIRILVGAAYGSDVDQICDVLQRVAEESHGVCTNPPHKVRMRGFGESSIDFNLLAWIDKPQDRGRISHELYMQVYKAFNEAGIEIPYAKRDLYIKEFPGTN
ncbi:MAG: mechanosensitive ion channel family protein [Gammaproteobacteria bacterium]|nr:mechanosensitive ion channel family protein [Gammaproteobacteria bacterium]